MLSQHKCKNLVTMLIVILAFFAIPHLIDDFLFDIPAEFGITNRVGQLLSGVFIVFYIWIVVEISQNRRIGFFGSAFMGGFLALAVLLKHIPEILKSDPYWSGWFSETLIVGVLLTGIALLIASILALRVGH